MNDEMTARAASPSEPGGRSEDPKAPGRESRQEGAWAAVMARYGLPADPEILADVLEDYEKVTGEVARLYEKYEQPQEPMTAVGVYLCPDLYIRYYRELEDKCITVPLPYSYAIHMAMRKTKKRAAAVERFAACLKEYKIT